MDLPITHTDRYTNGIRLHCVEAGPRDGPLVILLHGFPEFWYGWRHQIEPLAKAGFRLLAPDQRGYNRSDKPKGVENYQVEALAADAVGLIKTEGKQTASLVGHDWGAVVAWEAALRYPEQVEKLAILNVPHPDIMQRTLRSSLQQLVKSWYIFFFQLPSLPEAMLRADDWRLVVQMLQRSGLPGIFTEEDIEAYRCAWWQKDAMTSMLNWYRAVFRTVLKGSQNASMRRVSVPTLMLWGVQDIALSQQMAQPSIDLCESGGLVFFEDATHWVQHDEAAAVNQRLIDFLNPSP
jgi:pimeloyl-ACP methyl ester carboxylesterase